MAKEISCREVRRRIETQPKGRTGETHGLIAEHLRGCEACAALHARWRKIEQKLAENKRWLDKLAREAPLQRRPVFAECPLAQ